MIVKYDSLNRFEQPRMYLCSPSSVYDEGHVSGIIGGLVDTEAEENIFNFNAASQLNLRLHYPQSDEEELKSVYEMVANRRLIFMPNIGYFVITHVDETKEENDQYKDITAQSIEKEIEQKEVPYFEDGTYPFSTTAAKEGLFDTIIHVLPSWTIKHIDDEVASRYRTFEDIGTDVNCYAFMINDMQDAYECIFEFDTINRQISVFDKGNYVHRTSIRVSNNDVIDSLKISDDSEDLYTAINVSGDAELGIAAVNPTGSNTIYNFSYYLPWMSNGLREKITQWQIDVENARENYYALNEAYYTGLEANSTMRLNIESLDVQIEMYKKCRDNIVASQAGNKSTTEHTVDMTELYNEAIEALGGEAIVVSIDEQVEDLLNTIDGLMSAALASKNELQNEYNAALIVSGQTLAEITAITSSLSLEHILTQDEYDELYKYIFEGSYTDEYITVTDSMTYAERFEQMKTLYDRAISQLENISRPKQEFTVDVESFIFERDFSTWTAQLETGCLIDVEIEPDEVATLFLSAITINYDDKSMSLKFGSRYDKYDTASLFNDVLGNVSKSANSINYIKEAIYPIKSGEIDKLREAILNARALSMSEALSAQNQAFVIDGAGITGRKVNENEPNGFDQKQMKITSNLIVFTDDGWQTCKVAIGDIGDGKYGINADTIIGNLFIGNDLILSGTLKSANGSFVLDMAEGVMKMNPLWGEDIEEAKSEMNDAITTAIEEYNSSSADTIKALQQQLDNLNNNGIFSKFTIESDGVHIGYKSADATQPGGEIVIDGSTIWFKIGENSKAYINAAGFNFDYGILTTALTIGNQNDGTDTNGEWTWMKSQSGHFRLVYKG